MAHRHGYPTVSIASKFGSPAVLLAPILSEICYYNRVLQMARFVGLNSNTVARQNWNRALEQLGLGQKDGLPPHQLTQQTIITNLANLRRMSIVTHRSL